MPTPAPTQAELLKKLNELSVEDLEALLAHTKWEQSRHKHQGPPAAGWTVWLMLAGRGAGKALCIETPIATAAGWKRMGDLCDGDMVFDEQGTPCVVVKAHKPYMPRTMYRLTFSDGATIDADGEHLWTTLTHRARKQMTRHGITRVPTDWATYRHPLRDSHGNVTGDVGAETLTTEQLVESLTHSGRKDLNHCIPTAQPLNLPAQELLIDPYLLGVWLGDGASKDQVIWSHIDDLPFMEAHIQALGYETARKHDQGNTWSLRIQGFASQLKELGVFKNKHVPGRYLRASIEQRLALLRGLMDTDGYQSSKAAEFCNTNRALAEAVYELAVSLGEKPTFAEGRAKLYGRDCGERYRVTWRWNRFSPFSLPRKASNMAAPDGQSFKHGHRMIVLIEPIEPSTVRCITVSSASRLYLAGEAMIPTHNTRAAAEWVWWEAYQAAETRWLVCAPTSADIRDTCFEGDSGLISVMPEKVVKEYNRSLSEIILVNGSLIKGISAETPDRLRGGQWHGAWCHPAGTPVLMADGSEKHIDQIRVGDVVQTRFGPHPVTAAGLSQNPAPLYRISYGTTSLTCTADHPILVAGRGWVPAESVRTGDLLWIPLSLTDKYGVSAKTGTTGTERNSTFIGTFTNKVTELLRRVTLCITPITTQLTTTLRTWCLCVERSITAIIQQAGQRLTSRSKLLQQLLCACGKSCSWIQKLACSAVRSLKVNPCTKLVSSVLRNAWKSGEQMLSSLKSASAKSVKALTKPLSELRSIAASLAIRKPLLVGTGRTDQLYLNLAGCAGSNTKPSAQMRDFAQDPAQFAITAPISAVEKLKTREPVYNLTVDRVNEYVAGGVVVHNCDELAAWQYDQEAWDMIMFALRLGTHPRIVATTTPKPKALIRDLVERDGADVHVTRASTYENIANLAPTFQQQLLKFEGTTLGRQEIHAEVLNPEEQGIIKRNWIQLWPAKKPLPALEHIVMSLDTAFTEQTRDKKTSDSDPSACVVLGLFYENEKPNIILLDCWEDRLGMPDLIQKVKREMEVFYGDDEQKPMIKPKFGPSRMINTGRKPDTIVIEDKGSGISLRQMLAREGIIAHAYNPGKASKLTRLHMVSHLFAGGMVWFVESDKRKGQIRSWAEPLLYQLCSFSGEGTIKHDDLMDACTQGLRFLADKDMISVSKPKPVQPRLIVNERPRGNPYGV